MNDHEPASLPPSASALFAGVFDYAGLFAPASLEMPDAARQYAQHRAGPESWLTGRFVCPAPRLTDLLTIGVDAREWSLSVLSRGGDTLEEFLRRLETDLLASADAATRTKVDALETRWPSSLCQGQRRWQTMLFDDAEEIVRAHGIAPPAQWFFELPEAPADDARWREMVATLAGVLAEFNRGERLFRAGLKLRCGGTVAAAFPSSRRLAEVMAACRTAGVFWKATAGLHHAHRGTDQQLAVARHGFVNVLVAAVLSHVHHLGVEDLMSVLDEEDPRALRLGPAALHWRQFAVTNDQIAEARQQSLVSIGTCSIDEPLSELRPLLGEPGPVHPAES